MDSRLTPAHVVFGRELSMPAFLRLNDESILLHSPSDPSLADLNDSVNKTWRSAQDFCKELCDFDTFGKDEAALKHNAELKSRIIANQFTEGQPVLIYRPQLGRQSLDAVSAKLRSDFIGPFHVVTGVGDSPHHICLIDFGNGLSRPVHLRNMVPLDHPV